MHLHVGQRIRVELEAEGSASPLAVSTDEELARTAKATVRYIGSVAAARDPTAIMLGIEWDEGAARGRNDGSVAGKRYFTCSAAAGPPGTKAGSFIQPTRVWRAASEPSNLLQAIADKYQTRFKQDANASLYLVAEYNKAKESLHKKASAAATSVAAAPAPDPAVPAGPRHIPVLFQGEEYMQNKIAAQLASLVDMTLTQSDIAAAVGGGEEPPQQVEEGQEPPPSAGSVEQQLAALSSKIPRCATLDLTDNLLRDWAELARMAQALPALHMLALSSNHVLHASLFQQGAADAVPETATTAVATADAAAVTAPRPLLPLFSSAFSRLSILVFNGVAVLAAGPIAAVDPWASVLALASQGALPQLQELHLAKNGIISLATAARRELSPLVHEPGTDAAAAADAAAVPSAA